MPKTIYICEYCQRQFNARIGARWCEIQHETKDNYLLKNQEFLNELKQNNINPCWACQRSYVVYGSELNCECEKFCKDYNLFIGKVTKWKDM